ncbi:MAG: serine hydrolase [bacterium]|nr:serine hydrolase [bacterium]
MTPHSKFHLQSIFFAVIVLFFAVISSNNQNPAEAVQIPREKQLTATVVDAGVEIITPEAIAEFNKKQNENKVETGAAFASVALDNEPAPSTQTTAPNVVAAAFLAQDVSGEKLVSEYQSGYRWPIASITKLMTALIALEKIGPDQGIMMSQAAIETEGDSGFSVGEEYTVSDLIAAMMLISSNDAAAALADYIGTPRFFDLMQEKAYELKMTETSFIDATGLSYLNQSTARDIATLVGYIYSKYPEILEVSKQPTQKITERASQLTRTLRSINSFAGSAGFEGGKTGFTDESKGNLVSLFSYNDKIYTLIVFGTTDRFAETKKLYQFLQLTLNH